MEYIMYAVHLLALVLITVVAGGLLNHYMLQRGFAYNLYLTYLFIPVVGVTLYLVGGFTLWTLKGMVMALILLYASVQDVNTHEADDFLWVMLVILSLVNFGDVSIGSMVFGAIAVFVPQMAIAMFAKKGGIGGADIKISTAAALSLGFYGGVIGYMIGLGLTVYGLLDLLQR